MDTAVLDVDFTDTETVEEQLRLFRAKGQHEAGHEFITALPEEIRRKKAVAIEAAQIYLVQGHFIRGDRICMDAAGPLFREASMDDDLPEEIWDEDSVCLELIRAYIGISRHCKLKAAVSIATRVHSIW